MKPHLMLHKEAESAPACLPVGDTVVLERWTNDRTQLHIHVSKGATPPSPAGDGAAQGSSQAAARPAPRKQSRAATNKKSSSQA